MLFVETKTLTYSLNGTERIQLLEKLRETERTPILRSARLNCYENILLNVDRIGDFELAVAARLESENNEQYVRGDLFSLPDHILFLVFDESKDGSRIRAGIVYDSSTPEPFRRLDGFCREVRESLTANVNGTASSVPDWQPGKPVMPEGFKRFIARQDNDSLYTSLRKDTMTKRILAASKLEDENARLFLRTAKEAHIEGYAAKLLPGDTTPDYEFSISKLEDAGLVEREVQVSCRKTGHSLLRLPNANALVVVTVSDATCSECGAPIADEKVEEVIAPTLLASSLLEDGSWLVNRLHFILREIGVPESEIAVGPSEGEGYGQLMANICGESFLMVARDGDLTPVFARWAIDLEIETEASHLVVVATGRVHNQGRLLLLNHSRRRTMTGRDFELVVADGPAAAAQEMRTAFDRVSERVIAEQLCDLDNSVGLNVTALVTNKFRLLRNETAHAPTEAHAAEDDEATTRPLALTAFAGAMSDGIIDVEPSVPDDLPPLNRPPENIDGQIIPDAQAAWE